MAYPTDSRLRERACQHLVKLAGGLGITLRQNYNREALKLAAQIRRYTNAKQCWRMKATLKSLCTVAGRVWRDIDHKLDYQDDARCAKAASILARVKRMLDKKQKTKISSTACTPRRLSVFPKARGTNLV